MLNQVKSTKETQQPKLHKNDNDSLFKHLVDNFGKTVGVITLTGLLSSFWLVLAKRRKRRRKQSIKIITKTFVFQILIK